MLHTSTRRYPLLAFLALGREQIVRRVADFVAVAVDPPGACRVQVAFDVVASADVEAESHSGPGFVVRFPPETASSRVSSA